MSIYKCLSKFHEEVGKVSKDSKNPHYKSKYADIDTVLDAIREPLKKAGLCFTQLPQQGGLKTVIATIDGDFSIEGFCEYNLTKNDMQGLGSAITYARRYSLVSMLGLEAEDDDGNGAVKPKQQAQQETKPQPKAENPALVLFNKLKSHYKCSDDDVKAMLSFLNITSKDTDKIRNALNDFGSIIVFLDERSK